MKKQVPEQPDLFPSAKALKREAMERVFENAGDWATRAFAQGMLVISAHSGTLKTGEELRFLIAPKAGEPHHHNAWGSLIKKFIEYGVLTKTKDFVAMSGPKSNARETRLYRLTPHR